MKWYFCDVLHLNQSHLMKRGSFPGSGLRNDQKVVFPVDSSVFSGFAAVAASVFEAVFLCPANSRAGRPLLTDDW
jgi:hypothetical protein